MTLADLPVGDKARVLVSHAPPEMRVRLYALGIRPKCEVQVLRKGLFAGPLQLRIGTTELMLRRSTAKLIDVIPIPIGFQDLARHLRR